MTEHTDPKRAMLRHTLATLAYRAGKTLRDAPSHFPTLSICDGIRTPDEILAHIGDLMEWALSIAAGNETWNTSEPLDWEAETTRFFASLERFDNFLASDTPLAAPPERLFQGPIADALTHVGQLAMIRRFAEAPVRGENFFDANIETGQVGAAQPAPTYEF